MKRWALLVVGLYTGIILLTAGSQRLLAEMYAIGLLASFCLNIAQYAAVQERIPVAIFSLEMSCRELVLRMLCSEARVDSHRLRKGNLGTDDMDEFKQRFVSRAALRTRPESTS